jgi:predicted Fe-Mo cluster-binding NifX family protein
MKAAFSVWNDRIAPVFDVARHLWIVEAESGVIAHQGKETFPDTPPVGRAIRLVELQVNDLVCGAISRSLQDLLSAYGLRIFPFVAGNLKEVIHAWLNGTLERPIFAMPGCCGSRRRLQGIHRRGKGGRPMEENDGLICSTPRYPGRERRGGLFSDGMNGFCVCPGCGHKESHKPGFPCAGSKCPKCGIPLIRE